MRRNVLTLLGIAVLATTGVAQSPAVPAAGSMHLFLLVGQSNMAGRGKVEPQDIVPIPHVLMLDRQRTWVPAVDPMHFDKPIAGVGLGRTFAARIVDAHPDVTIGLIPAEVGGSPIDAWQPGVYYEPTRAIPGTMRSLARASPWHQGR